ncbi:hypothetical protein F0562_019861 [Nyssa sinensis]|uniref:MULE transposase domain-containing protein n=1 Tax=Nyssa sinensis TaxID=561372 RepID=A0A5J5BSJ7_9ASTE|nr:hypothetical protein F0562_019861 [Nyssa sinensis]
MKTRLAVIVKKAVMMNHHMLRTLKSMMMILDYYENEDLGVNEEGNDSQQNRQRDCGEDEGVYGGQLLAAIDEDGNNNMFPIAMAIVEAKTKDSWSWFITELTTDIGRVEDFGWTFISDKRKGIVETFDELLPLADHIFCLRLVYANFRMKFKKKELKDLM